jgi:hypothetical protein
MPQPGRVGKNGDGGLGAGTPRLKWPFLQKKPRSEAQNSSLTHSKAFFLQESVYSFLAVGMINTPCKKLSFFFKLSLKGGVAGVNKQSLGSGE